MRRQAVLIVLVAIACGGVALGISLLQTPTYHATASLAVSDPNHDLAVLGGTFVSGETPLQLASAAAPQVTRGHVVARVKQTLNSPLSVGALRAKVTTTIDPNSYLVNITATDRDASKAAAIADAFATSDAALTAAAVRAQFRSQAKAVQDQLSSVPKSQALTAAQTVETLALLRNLSSVASPLAVSATATVPNSPSSPKTTRNTIAGLVFGLLLGIALATARGALDRRLRHTSDVKRVLDQPIVGHIRSEALGHTGRAVEANGGGLGPLPEADEESFRILRQNVRYLGAPADTRTILVTSAMAEEGKSTVAACLAVATAESGARTLLVECDLRRPVLANRFEIRTSPGLTDYLTGNAEPGEILQPISGLADRTPRNGDSASSIPAVVPNLVCIAAGTIVPRPAELLGSDRFRKFLAEVAQVYDSVILDTAPLLPVADTLSMIPDMTTLLVCVRLKQTTRDQAQAAQSALDRMPEGSVGLVLTGVREPEDGYYRSDYSARASTAA